MNLAAALPSMFGFTVYSSIEQAGSTGRVPFPVSGERILGGHAVAAVGYDDRMKIQNAILILIEGIRFRVKILARPVRRPDGVSSTQFRSCGSGGCLRIAGGPASSSRRRVLRRNHRSLGGQTDAGCEAGAPPGRASPGAGGKMRSRARSFRLTREAIGRAGVGDDSAEAACRCA